MQPFKTLSHFCHSLLDPRWETYTILDDASHDKHHLLKSDLASLNTDDIRRFGEKYDIDFWLSSKEDPQDERRTEYFVHLMQRAVAAERLKELLKRVRRPLPYLHNLKDIALDGHHLISTEIFTGSPFACVYGDYGYELCPATGASNSSYWTTNAVMKIERERNVHFRIRLNPFIEKPLREYRPMQYRMTIYGIPLSWERLKKLKADEFGQWMNEKADGDHSMTEYVWRPNDKELHFTCEELPREEEIVYRGSRYFHAIFDKATGLIKHCDGAIRFYDVDGLQLRRQFHVRQPEVIKAGKRIKIFQIDKTQLHHEDFVLLAKSFFVWNDDVQRYFY
jgi:hypothetical protein